MPDRKGAIEIGVAASPLLERPAGTFGHARIAVGGGEDQSRACTSRIRIQGRGRGSNPPSVL